MTARTIGVSTLEKVKNFIVAFVEAFSYRPFFKALERWMARSELHAKQWTTPIFWFLGISFLLADLLTGANFIKQFSFSPGIIGYAADALPELVLRPLMEWAFGGGILRGIVGVLLIVLFFLLWFVIALLLLIIVVPLVLVIMAVPLLGQVLFGDEAAGVILIAEYLLAGGYIIGSLAWLTLPIIEPIGAYTLASTVGAFVEKKQQRNSARKGYHVAKSGIDTLKGEVAMMEIIPPDEMRAAQRRYNELMDTDPGQGNALATLAQELSARLNLRQKCKSMEAWTSFYEQVSARTVAMDEAITTYHRVFGTFPHDLPAEYRARVEKERYSEVDQHEFSEEKRLHGNQLERDSWKKDQARQRMKEDAELELHRLERDRAKLERLKVKKEMEALQREEKPQQISREKSLSAEEKDEARTQEFEKALGAIKGRSDIDDHEKERRMERLQELYQEDINKIYGQA